MNRRSAWRGTSFLVSLAILIASGLLVASETGDSASDQVGLQKERFQYTEKEPFVAVALSKKPETLREKWRFVDLDAWAQHRIDPVERALESERNEDEPNDERIQELETKLARMRFRFSKTLLRLEVDGDMRQFVRIESERTTMDMTASGASPREFVRKEWEVHRVVQDRDTTTSDERRQRRASHIYEAIVTPKDTGKKAWVRFYTVLVYSESQTHRFRVTYFHHMPHEVFSKASYREANALFAGFQVRSP